ncbi:MAG: valine--tRNA ligase, partial [Actinobacteria bacterium]|nr:valine--tRNA ligase [Actinomycetota bacterium]
EEVWSWWREGSVHRSRWPQTSELEGRGGDDGVFETVSEVLSAVRRVKSDAKASMRAEISDLVVTGDAETVDLVRRGESDLCDAARATGIEYVVGETLHVAATLIG